jgi:hypothetical protein
MRYCKAEHSQANRPLQHQQSYKATYAAVLKQVVQLLHTPVSRFNQLIFCKATIAKSGPFRRGAFWVSDNHCAVVV